MNRSGTHTTPSPASDRLVIALDVPSVSDARAVIDRIGDPGPVYKIGYQLLPAGGIGLVRELVERKKKVFCDFKFHDIGTTVEKGVAGVTRLGAGFLTVHAEPDVLKGAVAGRGDNTGLKLFAVTVLTSLSADSPELEHYRMPLEDLVLHRAEMAAQAGVDGVVASAREAASIRARFGNALQIMTPGIRPAGSAPDNQKRIVSPGEAVRAGADYLVVGRPVVNAPDPGKITKGILEEITRAEKHRCG